MELKTHEVAKELGMAPRTIRKWVQKYRIPCSKNDYGHYVYDAEAIAKLEALKVNSEIAGTFEFYEIAQQDKERERVTKEGTKGKKPSNPTEKKMKALEERISQTEQLLQQKADEVVSYQLLQQRKDIEELTKKVVLLESMIHELQNKQPKKYDPPLIFDQTSQPKRRGVFRSIFGF